MLQRGKLSRGDPYVLLQKGVRQADLGGERQVRSREASLSAH